MRAPILSSYLCEEADGWHWTVWQDDVVIGKGCAADLPKARTQLIESSIEHLAIGIELGARRVKPVSRASANTLKTAPGQKLT